ncbi:hypothetical protein PAPHI01_2573 [Pancytospora philotis]|nr:hypothetical protein PAPHI01_2573 [Pancytospora philotis]
MVLYLLYINIITPYINTYFKLADWSIQPSFSYINPFNKYHIMAICDLAPDARLKSPKDYNRVWGEQSAFTALWRAESYMLQRKIESDTGRIQWFLRGAPDNVVCWYASDPISKAKPARWTSFKVAYVSSLGTPRDNKLLFKALQRESWMSLQSFVVMLVQLLPDSTHKAIRSLIDKLTPEIGQNLRRWMQRRPEYINRTSWLLIALDRFASQWEPAPRSTNRPSPSPMTGGASVINTPPIHLPTVQPSDNASTRHRPVSDPSSSSVTCQTTEVPRHEHHPEKTVAPSAPHVHTATTHSSQSTQARVAPEPLKVHVNRTASSPHSAATSQSTNTGDPKTQLNQLSDLRVHYPAVLDNEIKPRAPCPIAECTIDTPAGQQVRVQWQGRIPQAHLEATRTAIAKLERANIIRRSESLWRNPIRPVLKPDGSVRICTNLIKLNTLVAADPYTIPLMSAIIEKMQGARYFTLVDLKNGYFQIAIRDSDCHKTAFKFEHTLYEWSRMPMGYKNAPALFQRIMDTVLNERLGRGVNVYLDDIVIYGRTKTEHDDNAHWVFQRLRDNNLVANQKKVQFCLPAIRLLGFIVDGTRVAITPEARDEIMALPRPDSTPGLRRLLGKFNVYRDFIRDMATIAVPLYERTGPHTKFEWSPAMETAFTELKSRLASAVALYHPDYSRRFILETDASDTGIGAVLLQHNDNGKPVPIRLLSRKLSPAERNYGITEKEFLAVVWAIRQLDYVLRGRRFSVITDHKALEVIRTKDDFGNARMHRWLDAIQGYDFDITYRKGSEMHSADALSRIHENSPIDPTDTKSSDEDSVIRPPAPSPMTTPTLALPSPPAPAPV